MTPVRDIPIAEITIGDRLRPTSDVKVAALDHLIEEYGFTTPILVRKVKGGVQLIDGQHRLETMRRRGAETIPAVVVEKRADEAKAMEAGQNLAAAGDALADALFLAAYQEAYERLHPETRRGAASVLARQGDERNLSSFCDLVAESRNITPRQVRKIVRVGREISRAEADRLRAAPQAVRLQDLLALAKADPDHRAGAVEAFAAGTVKKIADALKGPPPPPKDPVEEAFKALRSVWERAPEAARRRFVADYHAALSARVRDEAERRIVNAKLGEPPESPAADKVRAKFGPRAGRAAS